MAPRGRGRPKAGESRMDAAVEAMKKFGFEEKLVKQTARDLLKVYGGTNAWPLIEDGCYGTLFEILLKKNQEEEGGSVQSQMEGADQGAEGADQGERTMVTLEPLDDAEPPPSDITDNASATENTGMEELHGGEETPMISYDINLPPTILLSQSPVEPVTNQRRKPCYGWISDDDDGKIDGVVYAPSPSKVPEKPRRKSRWDVC